jgi:hypothetical protein
MRARITSDGAVLRQGRAYGVEDVIGRGSIANRINSLTETTGVISPDSADFAGGGEADLARALVRPTLVTIPVAGAYPSRQGRPCGSMTRIGASQCASVRSQRFWSSRLNAAWSGNTCFSTSLPCFDEASSLYAITTR